MPTTLTPEDPTVRQPEEPAVAQRPGEQIHEPNPQNQEIADRIIQGGDPDIILEDIAASGQVDLQAFYLAELARANTEQVTPQTKAWKILEERAAENEPGFSKDSYEEYKPRQISVAERIRRQTLSLQARIEGIKDVKKFQQLVDYFESTVTETERVEVKLPKGLSEERQKQEQEKWKAQGYKNTDSFYEGSRHTYFSPEHQVPVRFKREQVAILKRLMTSSNNPVEIAEGLRKMGYHFNGYTFRSEEEFAKLAQLFSAPQAKEAIAAAQRVKHWNYEWFADNGGYGRRAVEVGQIDFLIQLAQNPDPQSVLTDELVQKINVIAGALEQRIGVPEVERFNTIADNPDYLELASVISQYKDYWRQIPYFDNMTALNQAGVLKPLIALRRTGIDIGGASLKKLFNSYEAYAKPKETREKVIADLQERLSDPEIQVFMKDPAKQEFVSLLINITGQPISVDTLKSFDSLFGEGLSKKSEAVYLTKLLYANKDTKYEPNFGVISEIIHHPDILQAFTDQDFPGFLENIQIKGGFRLRDHDLYYDGNGRSEIAAAFNNPDTRQTLMQDATLEIIKALHPQGLNVNLSNLESYISLARNPNALRTINLLKDLGCEFQRAYSFSSGLSIEIKTLADSPESLRKLALPEVKNLAGKLKEEFKWKIKSSEVSQLLEIYDDKNFQQELFTPDNLEFIKKMRPNELSLLEARQLLAFDMPTRKLLIELAEKFGYTPRFYFGWNENKEMLSKLLANSQLKEGLFSENSQQIVSKLAIKHYYRFSPKDTELLISLQSDFPEFISELETKYKYSYREKDLGLLSSLQADKENLYQLLDGLVKSGYVLNLMDLDKLAPLVGLADKMPNFLADLKEVVGYQFNPGDSQNIRFIIQNNLTKEKLLSLKEFVGRNHEIMGVELNIRNIEFAFYLQQIEDILYTMPDISDKLFFIDSYIKYAKERQITPDDRAIFVQIFKDFNEAKTTFSLDRMAQFQKAEASPFGKAITDLISSRIERNKMLLDYACFNQRLEVNKINLVIRRLRGGASSDELSRLFEHIRWLPDGEITPEDTIETIEAKYNQSRQQLKTGFRRIFPNSEEISFSYAELKNLNGQLGEICYRFNLPSRKVTINSIHDISLPIEFIKEFNALKRQDPQAQFIPELAGFLINEASKKTTAYTMEDLVYSQIGETEDSTGRRRGSYTAEQLFEVMENNVEASLFTWTSAIDYQKEQPDSHLFIIANERTGPADLAAEYLPKDFTDRHKILGTVDYEKVFKWFSNNESLVVNLYDRFKNGEDVKKLIPDEIISLLGIGKYSIIPIYRLKVPSSLSSAIVEPEGIDTVINFLKLSSILGGRTLFMDESTRSAPRSIECLYNVLNRRQDQLNGARIRLLGKINGATGQMGTDLQEITPDTSHLEVAFIDPWHSQIKSITDDSVGFVPEVRGRGIVEIIAPSFTSVSPYGIDTIQGLWKQMIANEVSLRYEGFTESGGVKKRREEFKPAPPNPEDEIITQSELQEMAFSRPYRALVLDLDGTIGLRGEYDSQVMEKIKQLAENGTEVVISTARSLVNNSEYDGSVASFIKQLGELSDRQKSHIHLATENASVISTLADIGNPDEAHLISADVSSKVDSFTRGMAPEIKTYGEQGTVVLRNFPQEAKTAIMDTLRQKIEEEGLSLKVVSDSTQSIHIRTSNATKRNVLNWLEKMGMSVDDIAKIGDSPNGNDRPMLWGRGSFNVGKDRTGTLWTIHMGEFGGGPAEVNQLLGSLRFVNS